MEYTYYQPTKHLFKRYKERMGEHVNNKLARKNLQVANEHELARRANYMLLFSIHGRPGDKPGTEVRYYFDWNIVIDNVNKTIVTLYIDEKRPIPPVRLFGDRKLRKSIYNLWFRPKSKIRQEVISV